MHSTTQSSTPTFPPPVFQRLQPLAYLHSLLSPSPDHPSSSSDHHHEPLSRPDGRVGAQTRQIVSHSGSITSSHGSSILSLLSPSSSGSGSGSGSGTSIVCGIKFELSEPEFFKPNQGFIVINIDLGPMCSSKYRSGPPSDESQIISSRLKDILSSEDLIPLNKLVIEPNKSVWTIYIDLICLSNNGNLIDSALLAAVLAINNARLPLVQFDQDENQVRLQDRLNPNKLVPLLEHHQQISIFPTTFAVFENSKILPDPTLFEEEHSQGTVTIVLDSQNQLRHVWLAGSVAETLQPGGQNVVEYCIEFAMARKWNL